MFQIAGGSVGLGLTTTVFIGASDRAQSGAKLHRRDPDGIHHGRRHRGRRIPDRRLPDRWSRPPAARAPTRAGRPLTAGSRSLAAFSWARAPVARARESRSAGGRREGLTTLGEVADRHNLSVLNGDKREDALVHGDAAVLSPDRVLRYAEDLIVTEIRTSSMDMRQSSAASSHPETRANHASLPRTASPMNGGFHLASGATALNASSTSGDSLIGTGFAQYWARS